MLVCAWRQAMLQGRSWCYCLHGNDLHLKQSLVLAPCRTGSLREQNSWFRLKHQETNPGKCSLYTVASKLRCEYGFAPNPIPVPCMRLIWAKFSWLFWWSKDFHCRILRFRYASWISIRTAHNSIAWENSSNFISSTNMAPSCLWVLPCAT